MSKVKAADGEGKAPGKGAEATGGRGKAPGKGGAAKPAPASAFGAPKRFAPAGKAGGAGGGGSFAKKPYGKAAGGGQKHGGAPGAKRRWEGGSHSSHTGSQAAAAASHDDEGPANKKRRLKRERQAQRPEFDTVARSKEIWNKLRERKVPPEVRQQLVEELAGLVKGKVYKISMKHDASRVIQCAVQYGSDADRASIVGELEGHLVELSQLQYAHFIVVKLLTYVKQPADRRRVLKDLRGHVVKLAAHSIGARIIETALQLLPSSAAAGVRAELYGKEFALFDDSAQPHSLVAALAARPDRRAAVLAHVGGVVARLTEKALLGFEFSQRLLWEFVRASEPAAVRELVPSLLDAYPSLLLTRDGCRAAAACAAYGGAKERKRMMKALKGHVAKSLMHRDAYLAILRLVDAVDDTVTCQKMVLAELLLPVPAARPVLGVLAESWVPRGNSKAAAGGSGSGVGDGAAETDAGAAAAAKDNGVTSAGAADPMNAEANDDEEAEGDSNAGDGSGKAKTAATAMVAAGEADVAAADAAERAPLQLLPVALHKNGCKLLLLLMASDRKRYLDPEELAILEPVAVPDPATPDGPPVPTSRKDPDVRRRELLAFLRQPIEELCRAHATELMRSKCAGSVVLLEAVRALRTPELVAAVADAAAAEGGGGSASGGGSADAGDDVKEAPAMYEDPAGHLFMKRLLLREGEEQRRWAKAAGGGDADAAGEEEDDGPPVWFADALLERIAGRAATWASCNRGAFVLAAMAGVPSVAAALAAELEPRAAALKKLAAGEKNHGAQVLVDALAKVKEAPAAAAVAGKKAEPKAKGKGKAAAAAGTAAAEPAAAAKAPQVGRGKKRVYA